MKKFEVPELEIIELRALDVITESGDWWEPGEDEFPLG